MDYFCKICGKKVADILSGSKLRRNTVFICNECFKEKMCPISDDLLQENFSNSVHYASQLNDLMDIFGIKK